VVALPAPKFLQRCCRIRTDTPRDTRVSSSTIWRLTSELDGQKVTTAVQILALSGVGRLGSMRDATGTTSWIYEARGNVLSETRVISGETYVVSYTYDAADPRAASPPARDRFGGREASVCCPPLLPIGSQGAK
jgi:hypothetical protein